DWSSTPSSRFIPLPHPERLPSLTAPEVAFDISNFQRCVEQSAEWKRRHGFPAEIHEILTNLAEAVGDWEQVIVATPQLCVAAVLRNMKDGEPELAVFAANFRNSELAAAQPAFTVPDDQPEWFPPAIPEAEVRQAFVEWCQQRQLSAEEAQQCSMQAEGSRL